MGESTDSGGGGGNESNNEPRGTVFGVDGRSKTGSTSQDKAIGFTDGQGGKGSNYEALNNATSQQTSAAVAAANAAKAAGGNETAQQAAVGNILDSYNPDFVNRSGNLTESGQSAIGQAVNEALEDTTAFEQIQRDQQAANIMGVLTDAPPARAPADFDSQLLEFLDPTQPDLSAEEFRAAEIAGLRAPPAMGQDMQLMSLPSPSPARALQTSPYRSTTTQLLGRQMTSDLQSPEERQNILQEIRNRATVGDEVARQVLADQAARDELGLAGAGRVDMSAPNPFAAPARQALVPVGIASTPQATAASVLRGPDDVIQEQRAAQAVAQPSMEQNLLTSLDLGTGTTAPASAPVTDAGLYGGYEDDPAYDADIFGMPRYAGGQTGLDGQMQGFEDARQMGDFVNSATQGNFLTDILSFSPIMAMTGTDPRDANRRNVQDMMEAGAQFNQESGKLELDTGRGTLRMTDSGTVTYSGMPNPDYTGPFANLVNPPQNTGGDGAMTTNVAQTQQDPCPPGYRLVDGVCQPADDLIEPPNAPGDDFVINPTTGLPTVFQPTTQATQIGQINPFVLQPYPQQAVGQPVPQGIQALSPTGAALGRQV